MKPGSAARRLRVLHDRLFAAYGPQHWWPAETAFEVVLGAYLTQNTSWKAVERSLGNLRAAGALTVEGLRAVGLDELRRLIEPSGFYTRKAPALKAFVALLDAEFARLGARGLEQVRNHVAQLVDTFQHGAEMFALFGLNFSRQTVQNQGDELVDAGQGSAQFVRHVRKELIFELQLLLAAGIERSHQGLALDRITDGSPQLLAVEAAFDQVVLYALMNRFERKLFIVVAGEDHDRNPRGLTQHFPEGFRPVAVGQVQVQQHYRRRAPADHIESVSEPVRARYFEVGVHLHQP